MKMLTALSNANTLHRIAVCRQMFWHADGVSTLPRKSQHCGRLVKLSRSFLSFKGSVIPPSSLLCCLHSPPFVRACKQGIDKGIVQHEGRWCWWTESVGTSFWFPSHDRLLVQGATLAACYPLCASVFPKLSPKPIGSRAKTSFPPRKAYSAILCTLFNVKMPSSCDKTDAAAASKLILLQQLGSQ